MSGRLGRFMGRIRSRRPPSGKPRMTPAAWVWTLELGPWDLELPRETRGCSREAAKARTPKGGKPFIDLRRSAQTACGKHPRYAHTIRRLADHPHYPGNQSHPRWRPCETLWRDDQTAPRTDAKECWEIPRGFCLSPPSRRIRRFKVANCDLKDRPRWPPQTSATGSRRCSMS